MMFEIIIQSNVNKNTIEDNISNPIINIPEPSNLLVLSRAGTVVKNSNITKKLHKTLVITGIKLLRLATNFINIFIKHYVIIRTVAHTPSLHLQMP